MHKTMCRMAEICKTLTYKELELFHNLGLDKVCAEKPGRVDSHLAQWLFTEQHHWGDADWRARRIHLPRRSKTRQPQESERLPRLPTRGGGPRLRCRILRGEGG
jgi:hypothetical protein